MMTKRKFYKTRFTYEVLSEEPLGEVTLESLAEMCDSGSCVGRWWDSKEKKLDGKEAADALCDFGGEPGFFMLDDDGNDTEG